MTIESKGTYIQRLMDTLDFYQIHEYFSFIRLDVPNLVTTILSAAEHRIKTDERQLKGS